MFKQCDSSNREKMEFYGKTWIGFVLKQENAFS